MPAEGQFLEPAIGSRAGRSQINPRILHGPAPLVKRLPSQRRESPNSGVLPKMAVYLVGYDLHEGEDYEDLINALKAYGTWWHCLDSTWLIKTSATAVEIRDNLRKHIKNGDRLLVMRYAEGSAAWYGFSKDCADWLKNNLLIRGSVITSVEALSDFHWDGEESSA